MKAEFNDEQLAKLIRDSFETPSEHLQQQVQQIPQHLESMESWSFNPRRESLVGILIGLVGLWFLGLFFLYKDQLLSIISHISTLGSSIYYMIPIIGIVSILLIFHRFLGPHPSDCLRDPC